MAMFTLVVPCPCMFRHVSLPVTFHSELKSTVVAYKRLDPAVRSHVLLQEGFAKVCLQRI